jgi:hypothetical protein
LRRLKLLIGSVTLSMVTGVMATSCADPSTEGTPSAAAPLVDPTSPADPNRFIVDAYERATGTFSDPLALRNYYSAIASCMAAAGFDYAVPPTSDSEPEEVDRVTYIEEHGYGVFERFGTTPDGDPNEAIVAALGDGQREAYYVELLGSDDDRKTVADKNGVAYQSYAGGGCVYTSFAQLGVSMDEAMQNQALLDVEFQEALASVESDPAVVAGWTAWAECMAHAGYVAANRGDARALAHSYADDAQTLQANERRLADADVACDEQTRLQAVIDEARSRHLGAFYEANEETLRSYAGGD